MDTVMLIMLIAGGMVSGLVIMSVFRYGHEKEFKK